MLDAGTIDDLTKAANSVKVNSGACPQKGGAGSETGGARGPTRPDLDLSRHNKEEVPDARPLPDSGDNDPSATPLGVESSSEEEVWRRSKKHHLRRYGEVRPLFEPDEAMEEPERPDAAQLLGQKLEAELEARAAQVARPTAGAEKDAAQEGEGGDPKPRAEATKPPAPTCDAESGAEPKAGTPAAKSKALPKPPAPPCNADSGAEPKAGTPAAKSNALPKPPAVKVDPAPPKAGQPAGKTPTAGEEAEAGGEVEGEGRDPKPRAEAAESETQCAQAQTGLPAAPSPAPSGFDTPKCVPPGQGYHVPEDVKQMVLRATTSVSLH